MKWTSPADLRQQVQRWWDKGDILADLHDPAIFPKRLTLKTPTASELRDHFEPVRDWSRQLLAMPHIRLEMREFRHQVFGQNSLPAAAWVNDAASAIALLGQQKAVRVFARISASTAARQPKLMPWLTKRPHRALELADVWDRLLDIVDWLHAHPRPGLYLRQVDLPGIHSKFIEAQRGVLSELLDLALPTTAIDGTANGISQFNRRYGFRDKPERVRLRWLDPATSPFPAIAHADLTLDAASLAQLPCTVDCVFIIENETNFLAFPALAHALIIFGAGYGFSALASAQWLHHCRIYYWGDIDTHGFAILDELRSHFPHVQSLLMDTPTLLACEAFWGEESSALNRDLPRLTPEEAALYNSLRDNRLHPRLRLEQEHIPIHQLHATLSLLP